MSVNDWCQDVEDELKFGGQREPTTEAMEGWGSDQIQ